MPTERYTIDTVGHVWEHAGRAMVPRIVSAMIVHRRHPRPSGKICLPVWVLDHSLSSCGSCRTGSTSAPWIERPANEAHLYPPGVAYWENPGPERSVSTAFVTFVGGEQAGLDALTDGGKRCCRCDDHEGLLGRAIQEAAQVGGQEGEGAFLKAQSLLFRIFDLLHCARAVGPHQYVLGGGVEQGEPQLSAAVQEFLQAHMGERVTLGRIARALAVSPSTLTHKYTRQTGESPMRTLLRLRINRAKTLFLSGERLKIIADRTGFVDASHLSKVFRRALGLSPRNYVRAAGNLGQAD
jgi:AraC-like DNA-binding protein